MMIKRRVFLTIFAVAGISASTPTFSMDIFQAIESGDLNLVGELAEKVDVNEIQNKYGDTPLSWACRRNNSEIVKFLLSECSDETINKANEVGRHTPLYYACSNNNIEMVKLLLPRCLDETINKDNEFGCTPLYWACCNQNLEMVKLLLSKCLDETINKANTTYGFTPLYWVCLERNLEIVKLLLENGAKVDTKSLAIRGRGLTQEIQKYCDLALDYDATPNKMQFILNKAQDKDEFNFLVKLAFGRSLRELEVNKSKSPYETIFFELFANKDINLQKIFDVPTNGGLHDFMEQAAKKNCFRTYKSPTGKTERLGLNPMGGQTFFSNMRKQIGDGEQDKKRYKKLQDCCVVTEN